MLSKSHTDRIKKELFDAGMTSYGLIKMETNSLPKYIHEDEHIGGVVYGRTLNEKIGSAMIVATNKRVIFIDAKPFFTNVDEVSYDVVAGVMMSKSGPFAGVTLHTRVADYTMRFVNLNCADKFVRYITSMIERKSENDAETVDTTPPNEAPQSPKRSINNKQIALTELKFLEEHDTATLGTVDRNGNVATTVIHYTVDADNLIYFVTKDSTEKDHNIHYHGQVSLTIHDTGSLKMMNISGLAEAESDKEIQNKVFHKIVQPRDYKEGNKLPPVAKLKDGNITVVRIAPINTHYYDYSQSSW